MTPYDGEIEVGGLIVSEVTIHNLDIPTWAAIQKEKRLTPQHPPAAGEVVATTAELLDGSGRTAAARWATQDEVAHGILAIGTEPFSAV